MVWTIGALGPDSTLDAASRISGPTWGSTGAHVEIVDLDGDGAEDLLTSVSVDEETADTSWSWGSVAAWIR